MKVFDPSKKFDLTYPNSWAYSANFRAKSAFTCRQDTLPLLLITLKMTGSFRI